MSDEKLVFEFVFEYGVTIAKVTLTVIEGSDVVGGQIKSFDVFDTIGYFDTVCADVLYRCCADCARYESEVFESSSTFGCAE